MRARWASAAFLLVVLTVVWVVICGAVERPAERVSPAPQVNAAAVVWRTPEPPADPQAGDVWVNPKDGAEMVYVPAGEFIMGSTNADIAPLRNQRPKPPAEGSNDETPQFRVRLPAYWIDKCEVTMARYRRFCRETGREMPAAPNWGWQDDHPIVNVTWHDAAAYAGWVGERLPTEMEWEKAARGTDGRKYPWGSQWPTAGSGNFGDEALTREDPESASWCFLVGNSPPLMGYDDGYAHTAPVGSFPRGASPYGALDMAGNVWEWTADRYDKDAYRRYANGDLTPPASGTDMVLRGGSWNFDAWTYFRCARRLNRTPDSRLSVDGFRCVRSP